MQLNIITMQATHHSEKGKNIHIAWLNVMQDCELLYFFLLSLTRIIGQYACIKNMCNAMCILICACLSCKSSIKTLGFSLW